MEYKRVYTNEKVWVAVRAAHQTELGVFSSYSAPEGDLNGNPYKAVMMTEYGFKDSPCPLIGAETTWDVDSTVFRKNEKHKFWFCIPIEEL